MPGPRCDEIDSLAGEPNWDYSSSEACALGTQLERPNYFLLLCARFLAEAAFKGDDYDVLPLLSKMSNFKGSHLVSSFDEIKSLN